MAYLALLGRILLLGYERIVVKRLGHQAGSAGVAFLFFAIATLFLLPFALWVGVPDDGGFLTYVGLASLVYAVAFLLYVRSLSTGEASLVSPLYNFNVFFLLVLAAVTLGEPITLLKIVGVVLLVLGASFLNRQGSVWRSWVGLVRDPACRLMIICSLLMAVGRTIDGGVVQDVEPITYAFCLYAGISLCLGLTLALTRGMGEALALLRKEPRAATTAGAINAYSYLLLLIAFTHIDVSVAEPASMLGMVVTVVLARFAFGERIRDRLVAVGVMIVGAWLLFV